jgi:hypothetical protein
VIALRALPESSTNTQSRLPVQMMSSAFRHGRTSIIDDLFEHVWKLWKKLQAYFAPTILERRSRHVPQKLSENMSPPHLI